MSRCHGDLTNDYEGDQVVMVTIRMSQNKCKVVNGQLNF